MRTDLRNASAVLAALALGGCYAEMENKSLTLNQSLPVCAAGAPSCKFNGEPAALESLSPLVYVDGGFGISDFPVTISSSDFLKDENKQGPVTFHNTLVVNNVTLTMGPSSGASFSGVTQLELRQVANAGTCSAEACATPYCQVLATYDSVRDGPATTSLVMKGTAANLLGLTRNGGHMQSDELRLCVLAKGTLPTQNWSASSVLDMALKARSTF